MSNVNVPPGAEVQRSGKEKISRPPTSNKHIRPHLLDGLVIVGMGILLYIGALTRYLVNGGEPTRYRCYALAFWDGVDRKSTRLNSSHDQISYAVFCLKKKKNKHSE